MVAVRMGCSRHPLTIGKFLHVHDVRKSRLGPARESKLQKIKPNTFPSASKKPAKHERSRKMQRTLTHMPPESRNQGMTPGKDIQRLPTLIIYQEQAQHGVPSYLSMSGRGSPPSTSCTQTTEMSEYCNVALPKHLVNMQAAFATGH